MLRVEERDGIAVVWMRHGKANALDLEMCAALEEHFEALASKPIRAVVLTAQGPIFSAGVDLRRAIDEGSEYLRDFVPQLSAAFETVFFFPKPLVAAVNGHAIAGGCVLACAADRRVVAGTDLKIGIPELRVGVPFPTVALEILRYAVPATLLQNLVYLGETVSPEAALARGLADEVAEPAALLDRALAEAEELAALPPPVFALTKAQLRRHAQAWIEDGRERFEAAVLERWTAPETLDAIHGYVARTLAR